METAREVLSTTPLIDGHNDLPWEIRVQEEHPGDVVAYDLRGRTAGHTDIERLREGMVGGQFWSVYVSCDYQGLEAVRAQLEQIDLARRVVERYPDAFAMAATASDIDRIFGEGRIASLLGIEGGHVLANSMGALRAYYDLGVRYVTLTHNCNTDWADAASEEPVHGGLTDFGRELVGEMNRLGMLVDLSHTSPATMHDVLDVAEAPVIWSHASARAIVDHVRNVPDDVLRRLPDNGGVVMVTFVPSFVGVEHAAWSAREDERRSELEARWGEDDPRVDEAMETWLEANPAVPARLPEVADHIEHIRDVAGVDHVGIGGDFDGITRVIEGLEDVSTYPALFAELARRGWTEAELRKLAGENVLRVLRDAERVARTLQRLRPPSIASIEEVDGPGR
ncbi:MAG: dipeptidase [Gemmatimonadota bacterium]|jgi:membrane dipeptidase